MVLAHVVQVMKHDCLNNVSHAMVLDHAQLQEIKEVWHKLLHQSMVGFSVMI